MGLATDCALHLRESEGLPFFSNAEVSLWDILRRELNHGEPIYEETREAIKQVELDRREEQLEHVENRPMILIGG